MPIRNAIPLTFRASGVTDTQDATNAPPGSLAQAINLIPAPGTARVYVPRPAAEQLTDFTGFNTPAGVTALLVVGTRAYGMISSARNAGKDEPFCYDISAGAFVTINGVKSTNVPTTQATSGDWTPPTMALISTTRIMVTHPGFSGANKVGFIDISGFSSNTITGSTHTNTTVDTLSSNPITAGWQVGMTVSGTDIPANTTIVSLTATSITLSAAATGSTAGVTLTVAGGTSAAPLWGAGTTNTNALASVPLAVAAFNGRAWYAVGNTIVFSDALNPMQVTNATQALTLGDNQSVTAFGGLPLANVVAGGVVQSLIAFKGAGAVFQITGDSSTSNLASNLIAGVPGTLAPRTICASPAGLYYVAPDGLRLLNQQAVVSNPIGAHGVGVTQPFSNAIYPSRMAAAYNASVVKISVQDGLAEGSPWEDWWYDTNINVWTGPHTFQAAAIGPYYGGDGSAWVFAAVGVNAKLFRQDPEPTASSTYTENGTALSFTWQTSLLPDNEQTAANAIIESTQAYALPTGFSVAVEFTDEAGASLASTSCVSTSTGGMVWGTGVWGVGKWGGAVEPIKQYRHNWPEPVVFKQATLTVSGVSALGVAIGNAYLKYSPLGYDLAA